MTAADVFRDSVYSGVLGGSAVALYFVVVDFLNGQPLFTPSLLGSVLFFGAAAADVVTTSPGAVAYFSIAHIAMFTALGAAISWLVHEVELHSRHPIAVLFVLFAIIEVVFFVVAPLALSGVIERLGIVHVASANLLAAGTMGLYFLLAHREGAWRKLQHTTNELMFDSVYCGVLGGSAVALFFLITDALHGQPLFTPSLLGSVLFLGAAAEDVVTASPAAIAYFSIAHIVTFTALGAAIVWLFHEVELHSRHPLAVLLVLFAIIEVSVFFVAALALPGVIARLGVVRVGVANLLAAGAMALYLVIAHREGAWRKLQHTTGELWLDSVYCGVLGGSAVALFFLITDALNGQPLFTPSLMGSVLFLGTAAEDAVTVHPGAVAYFSFAHIAAFTVLGAAIVWLFHEVELHSRHPLAVLLVLFAIIEVSVFFVASLALPGVITRLGVGRVGIANLLAAGTMALYLVIAHREGAWRKLQHTTGELWLDSVYCGVLGGSAVALFFLITDALHGQPLFTPSLLGSVLFLGASAEDVVTVHPGAVAYFSFAHIAAFTVLGAAIVWLFHEVELHSRHPLAVLLVLFAIIEVSVFFVASLALPGVITRLGGGRVGVANLLAAGAMALYLVIAHREGAWQKIKHTSADLLYDSFYAGALGGSAVALFFLIADVLDGQPLFTPSLMGSVLFLGTSAEDVVKVRLDAVAYFGLVHFVASAVLGTAISWLVHEVELHARHPFVVLVVLFAIIEVSFFFVVSLAMPGVIARLGVVRVGIANLLAAVAMAVFFVFSHREDAWEKLKQKLKQNARLA